MSSKVWKFEITIDSEHEGSEYGEYLRLATSVEATKSVKKFLEALLVNPNSDFILPVDIKLIDFKECDFTGDEGNEELLKSYYYCREEECKSFDTVDEMLEDFNKP